MRNTPVSNVNKMKSKENVAPKKLIVEAREE